MRTKTKLILVFLVVGGLSQEPKLGKQPFWSNEVSFRGDFNESRSDFVRVTDKVYIDRIKCVLWHRFKRRIEWILNDTVASRCLRERRPRNCVLRRRRLSETDRRFYGTLRIWNCRLQRRIDHAIRLQFVRLSLQRKLSRTRSCLGQKAREP